MRRLMHREEKQLHWIVSALNADIRESDNPDHIETYNYVKWQCLQAIKTGKVTPGLERFLARAYVENPEILDIR